MHVCVCFVNNEETFLTPAHDSYPELRLSVGRLIHQAVRSIKSNQLRIKHRKGSLKVYMNQLQTINYFAPIIHVRSL